MLVQNIFIGNFSECPTLSIIVKHRLHVWHQGLVWQISPSFVTTPVRGVTTESKVCPEDTRLQWEWYNTTTSQHQQLYIADTSIRLKCNY